MASITDEYFQLTEEYTKKYGKNTIVLLQVGAFFEVYGLKNTKTNTIEKSQIIEFSQICQLNVSEKNICVGDLHVVMAGFRDYTLEKYLQKLSESGYTSVVFIQEKEGKNVKRIFHAIYSAGTYMSYDTDSSQQITNNIMCIWIEKFSSRLTNTNLMVCGVAVANIYTGESSLFEYQNTFYMNPTSFDELERCLSTHCPSEIIINSTTFDANAIHTILQYSGVKASTIHKNCAESESSILPDEMVRCTQQKYIQHILKTFFGEESVSHCAEFQTHSIATQAFCYLMHFIQEHNPNLVKNIQLPFFKNTSHSMVLANHTLKQLNIVDDYSIDGKRNGQYSSVLSFLNKCCSPMGRRLFQHQMIHPVFETSWLQREYDITEKMLLPINESMIPLFRKQLGEVRDIDKICRQLIIHKLYPSSIYQLYKSVEIIQQIHICLAESKDILDYLGSSQTDFFATSILKYLDEHFVLDSCKNCQNVQTFEENIIRRGISVDLDGLILKYDENMAIFHEIRDFLNNLMKSSENNGNMSSDTEYIKIHTTEKSGISLQITKKRASTLKTIIKNITNPSTRLSGGLTFSTQDIKFSSASTSNDEIELHCLEQTCRSIFVLKEQINKMIAKVYEDILRDFENIHLKNLENISKIAAKMDVLQCKAYIAERYNYCKPQIEENAKKSFVDARDLRHVLIEHIQTNELYVTNDICLGKDCSNTESRIDGILLYGTNAVGKTSLIRALGISIIMAQSGLYVPCSQFFYKPYTSIFSRILGNDNLFKGLSTFAVEMSELRMILRNADENSLILGDELCSGTETESALSIFMAGLMDLHKKTSSFVFATHFHEIIRFDEMRELGNIVLKHMAVHYDRELDCLVYDRILRDGPGNRMYGLEVCKSLYLPDEFLGVAYKIRNKYYPENRGELSHPITVYNAQKIRGLCEMCKTNIGEETHHLQPQKDANDKGFIGSIHKNHPANLMSLCESCHLKMHHGDESPKPIVQKRKKTTKGYTI